MPSNFPRFLADSERWGPSITTFRSYNAYPALGTSSSGPRDILMRYRRRVTRTVVPPELLPLRNLKCRVVEKQALCFKRSWLYDAWSV